MNPFKKKNIVMRNREALQAAAAVVTLLGVGLPVVKAVIGGAIALAGGALGAAVNGFRQAASQK